MYEVFGKERLGCFSLGRSNYRKMALNLQILLIWIFLSAITCMNNFSYHLFTFYLIFVLVKTVINSFTISDSLLQPPSELLRV